MLELHDMTASYNRSHPILHQINLCAKAGEITVLLGPNGSGKSTLLHTVIGDMPYTGEICINGASLRTLSPQKRAQLVSLLPQHLPVPALSVRETVALGLSPRTARMGKAEWQEVDAQLQRLEISPLTDRAVCTLSGGERQKVFLAMLLVQNTPVLLLDEPTTYMDAAFTARFYTILKEECAKGKAVLTVMHDVGEALLLADRVACLDATTHSLAFVGTPAEALEQQIPEQRFGLHRYTATREGETVSFFRGV